MSKFKIAYLKAYRPFIDKYADKYFTLFVYHVSNIIYQLSLIVRGYTEEYIINRGYANLSQYEKVLTEKSIIYFTMQIKKNMTWVEIHDKIYELTKIDLSKRQCYKLQKLAD